MKIQSAHGHAFELSIVGYQFPRSPIEWHDRNWLKIRIKVVHPRGGWTSTDPSLLTSELLELADWLDAVAGGKITKGERPFIEPNLRFEVGRGVLRIFFELESRPRWAKANGAGLNDLWVEFPLRQLSLTRAASDIRKQLKKFPVRAGN